MDQLAVAQEADHVVDHEKVDQEVAHQANLVVLQHPEKREQFLAILRMKMASQNRKRQDHKLLIPIMKENLSLKSVNQAKKELKVNHSI